MSCLPLNPSPLHPLYKVTKLLVQAGAGRTFDYSKGKACLCLFLRVSLRAGRAMDNTRSDFA